MRSKTLFLDRDGVINIDHEYVHKIEDFEFCEGIFEVLKEFQKRGYLLIVVTNQSGIARGYYSEKDFWKLTDWMIKEFAKRDITIDKVYHCPHSPEDNCDCRKPKSGMFEQAKVDFDIDMKNSWIIGDKISDIEAAKNSDVENLILVDSKKYPQESDLGIKYRVNSIFDTIPLIQNIFASAK